MTDDEAFVIVHRHAVGCERGPLREALVRLSDKARNDTRTSSNVTPSRVTVPLTPSPAMREALTGQCGRAYAAIRRWHPGLPMDPHPTVQAALEDAFMEAYRLMTATQLQMQNGTSGR